METDRNGAAMRQRAYNLMKIAEALEDSGDMDRANRCWDILDRVDKKRRMKNAWMVDDWTRSVEAQNDAWAFNREREERGF